jgi:hypothetical protein
VASPVPMPPRSKVLYWSVGGPPLPQRTSEGRLLGIAHGSALVSILIMTFIRLDGCGVWVVTPNLIG